MEKPALRWPSIDPNCTADIAVIGSGIAGLSIAYEALQRGAKVVVLDRGLVGRGITSRTSAHLTSALNDIYHEFTHSPLQLLRPARNLQPSSSPSG
jgi:hypothetical protein